jgi:LysM repeat protein
MRFLNFLRSLLFGKKEEINKCEQALEGNAIVEIPEVVAEKIAEKAVPVKKKPVKKKK